MGSKQSLWHPPGRTRLGSFLTKWAPAVWILFHDTASPTKGPLGSFCNPLLCRSKKLQCHSSMIYRTISTDCSVLLCPLPEGIMLQLFKSLIAVLKCNSGWAVTTDFILESELKTEWKKLRTVAQSPGSGPKWWRIALYFCNTVSLIYKTTVLNKIWFPMESFDFT